MSEQEYRRRKATPWMGVAERAGQYASNLWYAVFSIMLMRRREVPQNHRATAVDLQRAG